VSLRSAARTPIRAGLDDVHVWVDDTKVAARLMTPMSLCASSRSPQLLDASGLSTLPGEPWGATNALRPELARHVGSLLVPCRPSGVSTSGYRVPALVSEIYRFLRVPMRSAGCVTCRHNTSSGAPPTSIAGKKHRSPARAHAWRAPRRSLNLRSNLKAGEIGVCAVRRPSRHLQDRGTPCVKVALGV